MSKNIGASRKEEKRESAAARQAEYNTLTTAQKVEQLDRFLGAGIGAKRQRTRLAAQVGKVDKKVEKVAVTGKK